MLKESDVHTRIDEAIGRLISVDRAGENARLSLPIAYPSGQCAAVEISINNGKCFITDCAIGYAEAEYSSAQSYYAFAARAASHHFGVGYDGMSVFATWAALDKLEGAIVAVANASVQAVSAAVLRAVTDKERRSNAALFDRVSEIFGVRHVAKTAELRGQEAQWDAHNVVSRNGRIAVFEFVATHQNSIANKFQMFSDLSRAQEAEARLSLNSVVRSLAGIGAKGAMLADVSNMLELQAANHDYLRYAKLVA